jgi:hypothetical protein
MADIPEETVTTILELIGRLAKLIDRSTATELSIFDRFGEIGSVASILEQLQNIKERATSSYSRLSNLLLRISEIQPIAPTATLDLLARTIERADATANAGEATVQEAKNDWNIL